MMINVPLSAAAEIDRHHQLAKAHAESAIQHAVLAGRLLLQVKTQLMHGEWGPWLAANVSVSERQAQRYMRAALGKPVPRHVKSDTVSLLPAPSRQSRPDVARAPSPWIQLEIPDIHADLI